MGRATLPILIALAIIIFNPPGMPSQPPIVPGRGNSSEEIQQLKRQYIKLRTELKSRRMLKSILEVDANVDLRYIASQYGLQRLPEFTNLSDEQISAHLQDLEHEFHIRPLIYGSDDLEEIYREPPDDPATNIPFVTDDRVLKASKSVVAIISKEVMVPNGDSWTLTTIPLTQVLSGTQQLCDFDRFFNAQCADVRGTGFLVEDQVIATAGHLVQVGVNGYADWLESVYFVFEYVMEAEGRIKTSFKADEVYRGIEVLADHSSEGADWALIKLDRLVTGRDPLLCRKYGKADENNDVYMLGHPHGMPMKYSGPGRILDNDPCHYFLSDLDAHPYNSGSPVFNAYDNQVEGILARDAGNFAEFCECYATAVYNSQMGTAGVEVTRSVLFKRCLEWPDHIFIESTVPTAIVKVTTSDGSEFLAPIPVGTAPVELPYSDMGVLLLGNIDECWIPYFPLPGELWKVVPSSYAGMNVMEKVCE